MVRRVVLPAIVVLAAVALLPAAGAAPSAGVTVVEDDDPVALAVALSQLGWGDREAGGAVVGSADSFPDSLGAVPLAASVDGPALVVGPGPLPAVVADELRRVLPSAAPVFIAGGTFAVAEEAEQDIRNLGFRVQRVAGPNRVDTAVEIARALGAPAPLFLAEASQSQYALVAGAAAARVGGAVLLSSTGSYFTETQEYVDQRDETVTVVAVGRVLSDGRANVSYDGDEVESSVLLADAYVPEATTVVIAARSSFVPQLAGGSLAARLQAPLLLTPESELAAEVDALLRERDVTTVVLVAGEMPFAPIVERQVRAAVAREPRPPTSPTATPRPTTTGTPSPTPTAAPGMGVRDPVEPVARLAGAGRIETAVETSRQLFDDDGAGGVVLARADQFPDALAGTPLAVARRAPLLLSSPVELPPATLAEVERVLPAGGTVTLLGGEAALAPAVATALVERGYAIERVSGPNRFATAAALAEALGAPDDVLVASGNRFPDALGAGPAAASVEGAVLLTADESLPPETAAYLDARPAARVAAVGGPAARAVPTARPLVGADRYATNVALAEEFFPAPGVVGLATGLDFPDALAGGTAVGLLGGPVLLSDPAALPEPIRRYLEARRGSTEHALLFGGERALSAAVRDEIGALVGG